VELPAQLGRKARTYIATAAISGPTLVTYATITGTFAKMNANADPMSATCATTRKKARPGRNFARIAKISPATSVTFALTGAT